MVRALVAACGERLQLDDRAPRRGARARLRRGSDRGIRRRL